MAAAVWLYVDNLTLVRHSGLGMRVLDLRAVVGPALTRSDDR
jgi:hypothetical protein